MVHLHNSISLKRRFAKSTAFELNLFSPNCSRSGSRFYPTLTKHAYYRTFLLPYICTSKDPHFVLLNSLKSQHLCWMIYRMLQQFFLFFIYIFLGRYALLLMLYFYLIWWNIFGDACYNRGEIPCSLSQYWHRPMSDGAVWILVHSCSRSTSRCLGEHKHCFLSYADYTTPYQNKNSPAYTLTFSIWEMLWGQRLSIGE